MEDETHENIDDDVNEDKLYEIDKFILDGKKDVSVRLKVKSKLYII